MNANGLIHTQLLLLSLSTTEPRIRVILLFGREFYRNTWPIVDDAVLE